MAYQPNERRSDMALRLEGYRLATAEVIYYLPDHPDILQSFVWQTMDLAPRFPRIHRFLDHWRAHIEATIHSVRLAHAGLMQPVELRHIAADLRLN